MHNYIAMHNNMYYIDRMKLRVAEVRNLTRSYDHGL